MKTTVALILIVLAGAAGAVRYLSPPAARTAGGELIVYCAAGLKKPVEAIAAEFERETGTAVRLQYGGTASLLAAIRLAQKGDLFIPADQAGLTDARKSGSIGESVPLVAQHPVIAVRAGNPRAIQGLSDLLRSEVKLALANPEAAAIGRTVQKALGGAYPALAAHAAVQKPTVTEIAADLSLGTVDAAIVWNSTVPQFAGLLAVEVPELSALVENASAAVLSHSAQKACALRFARYLAAPEKGGIIFQRFGFSQLASGDLPLPAP